MRSKVRTALIAIVAISFPTAASATVHPTRAVSVSASSGGAMHGRTAAWVEDGSGTTPSGLPFCELHGDQLEGFPSALAADEAIAGRENEEAECQIDPRETTITSNEEAPPPHDGYHHNGQQTSNYNFEGGRITAESQNVNNLAHDGSFGAFVVTRVFLKKANSSDPCPNNDGVNDGRWVEIGTSEVSWDVSDRRRIYWYRATESGNCEWHFTPFSLAAGFFIFRVWNNGGIVDAQYWDTACDCWALADSDAKPDCATNACAVENYNEVYTDNVAHPTWNDNIEVNSSSRTAHGTRGERNTRRRWETFHHMFAIRSRTTSLTT